MAREQSDDLHAHELAERFRENQEPLCPQFHVCHLERLYPVRGYCVLAQSPGWFMVPSIQEYRELCTTVRYSECCWFGAPRGKAESPERAIKKAPGP